MEFDVEIVLRETNHAVTQRIGDNYGDYMRLLSSRGQKLHATPVLGNLVEFSLLFPEAKTPTTPPYLRMKPDGTVGELRTTDTRTQ